MEGPQSPVHNSRRKFLLLFRFLLIQLLSSVLLVCFHPLVGCKKIKYNITNTIRYHLICRQVGTFLPLESIARVPGPPGSVRSLSLPLVLSSLFIQYYLILIPFL